MLCLKILCISIIIIHLNIEQKIGWRTCLHCLPPLPIPRWPVRSAATPSQLVPKEESLGRGRIVRYPHHLSKRIMSKNAPPAPKTRDNAMAAIAMGVKGGGGGGGGGVFFLKPRQCASLDKYSDGDGREAALKGADRWWGREGALCRRAAPPGNGWQWRRRRRRRRRRGMTGLVQ